MEFMDDVPVAVVEILLVALVTFVTTPELGAVACGARGGRSCERGGNG